MSADKAEDVVNDSQCSRIAEELNEQNGKISYKSDKSDMPSDNESDSSDSSNVIPQFDKSDNLVSDNEQSAQSKTHNTLKDSIDPSYSQKNLNANDSSIFTESKKEVSEKDNADIENIIVSAQSSEENKNPVDSQPEIDSNQSKNDDSVDWVAQHKLDLLTEQAERTELLQQQKQVILAESEQNLNNLEKFHKRYEILLERLDVGRETSLELHNFLRQRHKTFGDQQSEMESSGTAFGSREIGSVRQAAISQDHFRANSLEQHKEMTERIFTPALRRLDDYVKSTRIRYDHLRSEGSQIYRNLHDKKNAVDTAWTYYEGMMSKSVHLATRGKSSETDPFLAARQYELASASYHKSESEYSLSMSKLFGEITTADGRRIDEMKSILLDWFIAEKSIATNRLKLIGTALAYIKAIDREKDVNEFVNSGEFIVSANGQTIFDVLPKSTGTKAVSSIFYKDILKHGILYRQGRFISSNWKSMFVIITRSGFIHSYDSKKEAVPFNSISLSNANITLKRDIGDTVFEISVPNSSMFSLSGSPIRFNFKAETEELMVEWICEINKHVQQ